MCSSCGSATPGSPRVCAHYAYGLLAALRLSISCAAGSAAAQAVQARGVESSELMLMDGPLWLHWPLYIIWSAPATRMSPAVCRTLAQPTTAVQAAQCGDYRPGLHQLWSKV